MLSASSLFTTARPSLKMLSSIISSKLTQAMPQPAAAASPSRLIEVVSILLEVTISSTLLAQTATTIVI